MNATRQPYQPAKDHLRIRDFLSATFGYYRAPLNWRIERWNYARYFVAPMLGSDGYSGLESASGRRAIQFWEERVALWENDSGEIVGVANIEHPDPDHGGYGEFFIQRHPGYTHLLPAMLDYAADALRNEKNNSLHIYVYDFDAELAGLLEQRGYRQDEEASAFESRYMVGELPPLRLPDGFRLQSMAEENDIERRRKIFGLSFNHPDPVDWPSAFSYHELQKAPDYRRDQDLYIIGPDGEHVACCIFWMDSPNDLAMLEPVGTHPDYRRLGLGREVVWEAIRRAAALGAREVQVGSGQRFYQALGFERAFRSVRWSKAF